MPKEATGAAESKTRSCGLVQETVLSEPAWMTRIASVLRSRKSFRVGPDVRRSLTAARGCRGKRLSLIFRHPWETGLGSSNRHARLVVQHCHRELVGYFREPRQVLTERCTRDPLTLTLILTPRTSHHGVRTWRKSGLLGASSGRRDHHALT